MNRRHIKDVAKSDLLAIAKVRHQLASARMSRLAQSLHEAEQRAESIAAQLTRLKQEARLVRESSLRAVTDSPSGIGLHQRMLRALDVDTRRTHVRLDMQTEQCRQLLQSLSIVKKVLAGLDVRLEFYKKARRLALSMREERADQMDD
jgi:hypothetical protein